MIPTDRLGTVDVVARLELDIDGQRATLTGCGGSLILDTPAPAAVLDAVAGAALPAGVGSVSGPRALGRVASTLAELGLQVQVTGPSGPLVTLGGSDRSLAGRILTGSTNVSIGAPRAVLPLAVHRLRASLRGRARVALAAATVLVVTATAAGIGRRRRA